MRPFGRGDLKRLRVLIEEMRCKNGQRRSELSGGRGFCCEVVEPKGILAGSALKKGVFLPPWRQLFVSFFRLRMGL